MSELSSRESTVLAGGVRGYFARRAGTSFMCPPPPPRTAIFLGGFVCVLDVVDVKLMIQLEIVGLLINSSCNWLSGHSNLSAGPVRYVQLAWLLISGRTSQPSRSRILPGKTAAGDGAGTHSRLG